MADKTQKDTRNRLQKIGGLSIVPYLLKAAGFDGAASTTGYPDHVDAEITQRLAKKKKNKYSQGGQIKPTKFKGTF